MHERQNIIHNELDMLSLLLVKIKSLPVHYEYTQEKDGSLSGRTIEFQTIENAPDKESLEKILAHGMKCWAEVVKDDFDNWSRGREGQIPYLIKALLSSEEELISCLHGRLLEDI